MTKVNIPNTRTKLRRDFYARRADEVAKDLLGRILVVEIEKGAPSYLRIEEVAAYEGSTTTTAESAKYAPGMLGISKKMSHFLMDIGTGERNRSSCVTLVAGTIRYPGNDEDFVRGAGKLSERLQIDDNFNSIPLYLGEGLKPVWIGGTNVSRDIIRERNLSGLPENCRGYFYFRD